MVFNSAFKGLINFQGSNYKTKTLRIPALKYRVNVIQYTVLTQTSQVVRGFLIQNYQLHV